MQNNICNFIPYHKDYHSIHTITFVLETHIQKYEGLKTESVYKMHYVCGGNGILHTLGKSQPLAAGDVFFTFPATPFCIESVEDFTYCYISFLGSRCNMIMEKLKISDKNFLFHGCEEIYGLLEKGFTVNPDLTDLISESILLYTFSVLGTKLLHYSPKSDGGNNTLSVIKKYIDDNFSKTDFSLDGMATELGYNKKYLSSLFKKKMEVGIIEYLSTIRIQNACTMMQQGMTGINDIAVYCGYDDPLYFSKVFKNKTGMSPRAYIKTLTDGAEP